MVHSVKKDDLHKLLPLLEANLSYSLSVRYMIKLMMDGKLTESFNVWTDKLECPSAVAISANQDKCKNPYYRSMVFAYGSDNNVLSTLFNQEGVLNTSDEIFLYCTQDYIVKMLRTTTPLGKMKMTKSADTKIFEINETDEVLKMPLPEGFSVGCVTQDLCNKISSVWKYSKPGLEDILRDVVQWGFLSVCIYNHENEPVAWVMQRQFGFIGNLHVMEEYRGRGLAKFALSKLTNDLIKQNQPVYAAIDLDNTISALVHERVGFKNYCKELFSYRRFMPERQTVCKSD